MSRKLGRNDPCWCGSGKKYKKCHLNREIASPLPYQATAHTFKKAAAQKVCLHPLAAPGVCNKIISAHTIQRSRILERIVDTSNHVRTFFPFEPDNEGKLKLHRVGWREASTFTGFCAKHDDLTFKALEVGTFEGTAQQRFLIGYRAVCHEVYQKSSSLKAMPTIRSVVDRGKPLAAQKEIQEMWDTLEAGTAKGLSDFLRTKAAMDAQVLKEDYSGWSTAIVRFQGELCIASTGAVSVNRDLEGRDLQTLHDPSADIEPLLFGVVAVPCGGVVALIWPPGTNAPRAFVESLLRQDVEKLPGFLTQFMFAYVENTYFSDAWWKSLSLNARRHLASLAAMTNAYYTSFRYLPAQFVPWRIDDIAVEYH
jgi:hypothetical protein